VAPDSAVAKVNDRDVFTALRRALFPTG